MSPGARTVSGKRRSDFHDPIRLAGVLQFTQILRSSGSVDQDWRSRHLITKMYAKIRTSCRWDRRAGCRFRFGWSGYCNRGASPTGSPPDLVSRRLLGPGLGQ